MKVKGYENLEKKDGMVINNDLSDLDRYKREIAQSKRMRTQINSLNDLTKKIDQIFDEIRQIKELLRNR